MSKSNENILPTCIGTVILTFIENVKFVGTIIIFELWWKHFF